MKNQITNLITKIISILVIMLMMVNSSLMLVISVAVDTVQKNNRRNKNKCGIRIEYGKVCKL